MTIGRVVFISLLISGLAFLVFGQARSVTLSWTDNQAGATYTVYRAPGVCPQNFVLPPLASGIAAKTYLDTTVVVGNSYCYAVTAVVNSKESPYSVPAGATVVPYAPTNLTAQ